MGRARRHRRSGRPTSLGATSAWGARALLSLLLAFATAACWDFQKDVAEGPSPLSIARYATISVQYRQPRGCVNVTSPCDTRVVFFGSWMRPGEEVVLDPGPGLVWTGEATSVPVNWPPVEAAHLVRIFDPHLAETSTGGVSAARLTVGGQLLTTFDSVGTPLESALVYVDDVGVGHNPP